MKNRNIYKLCLDAVMLVLMLLMYSKNIISLAFHEIGGIALFVLFLLHLVWNGRWIAASTSRFFSKGTSGTVRALYVVDALLLVDFLFVLLGGVFISKVVFSFSVPGSWKSIHYFASALAVVLMGVHIGFHFSYIRFTLKKALPFLGRIARPIGVVLLCVVLGFGVYSISTTSFVHWLSMPFTSSGGQFADGGHAANPSESFDGSLPADGAELPGDSSGQLPQTPSASSNAQAQNGASTPELPDGTNGRRSGNGMGDGTGRGQGGEGKHLGGGEGNGKQTSVGGILLHLAQWLSIIAVFAAIAYWLDRLLHVKKKSPASKGTGSMPQDGAVSQDTDKSAGAVIDPTVTPDNSKES